MKFYSAASAVLLLFAIAARAQPTAFIYQGQLNDSNAVVTGVYDFRFQIYNASSSVVAGPLTNAPVGVTNGLFTTTLDFGSGVFDGTSRSLEIGVRGYGDTNAYTVLSPRQQLLSVPYAIQSITASNAMNLSAPLSATNLTGTIPNSLLSTNVAILTNSVIFSGGVTATNFIGNGFGLSNVPAAALTGTIADARLSTNVAFLNANANFQTNVGAVQFTGSGHGLTNVPGAFFWVTVSGTNISAQSNVGYICTNNVYPVTVTLPLSPSVGDVFKIAGVGGAGWILAQNTNQIVLSGNLSDDIGQSWTARGATNHWSAVTSSADGSKLAAVIGDTSGDTGVIYTSTNSGVTWTAQNNSGSRNWSSVASSADGTKLVAAVGSTTSGTGNLFTSTDSGMTWNSRGSSGQWVSVASSADGTRLVAANYAGTGAGIYTSVNSGTNWVSHDLGSFGSAVASSADGMKLAATVYGSQILTSTNAGTNWTAHGSSLNWTSISSSSDGSRLVATVNDGQTYISTDSGATWTAVNSSEVSVQWTATASSSDGSRLAAVYSGPGYIFTSPDSGATWLQQLAAGNLSWTGIACSSDGSILVAVANGNQIYTSSQGSTTTGAAGYLTGARLTTLEVIYAGNNIFLPLSHEGTIRAY